MNGFIGLALMTMLGTEVLGWTLSEVARGALGSCFAGTVSLFGVLKAERIPWIRRIFLGRPLKVWFFFVTSFFGQVFVYVPRVRPWEDFRAFLVQMVPLMIINGFTIVAFGPIQDRIVWRRQRQEAEKAPPEKAAGGEPGPVVKAE